MYELGINMFCKLEICQFYQFLDKFNCLYGMYFLYYKEILGENFCYEVKI